MVNSIVNSNAKWYEFVILQFAGYRDFKLFEGVFISTRKKNPLISESILPSFSSRYYIFWILVQFLMQMTVQFLM